MDASKYTPQTALLGTDLKTGKPNFCVHGCVEIHPHKGEPGACKDGPGAEFVPFFF